MPPPNLAKSTPSSGFYFQLIFTQKKVVTVYPMDVERNLSKVDYDFPPGSALILDQVWFRLCTWAPFLAGCHGLVDRALGSGDWVCGFNFQPCQSSFYVCFSSSSSFCLPWFYSKTGVPCDPSLSCNTTEGSTHSQPWKSIKINLSLPG